MPAVEIHPNISGNAPDQFLARCGDRHAVGKTAGQALDALNAILATEPTTTGATWVVIQQPGEPDEHFTAAQIGRLQELVAASRRAAENGETFPDESRVELQGLIDAELAGSARRAAFVGANP